MRTLVPSEGGGGLIACCPAAASANTMCNHVLTWQPHSPITPHSRLHPVEVGGVLGNKPPPPAADVFSSACVIG